MGNSQGVCHAEPDEVPAATVISAHEPIELPVPSRHAEPQEDAEAEYGVSPRHKDHFENISPSNGAHMPKAVMSFQDDGNDQHLSPKNGDVLEEASPTHNKKQTACHNGLGPVGGKCMSNCHANPSGSESAADPSIKFLENHDHSAHVIPNPVSPRNVVPLRDSTKQYEFNYYDHEIQIPATNEDEEGSQAEGGEGAEGAEGAEEEMWAGEDGVMYTAAQWAEFENGGGDWNETAGGEWSAGVTQ